MQNQKSPENKESLVKILKISSLANRKEVSKKRHAKYRRILDYSIQIIREHGQGNLTLQAVADKMNLKRPALYRYFISVRELWIAVQIDFQNDINNLMQDIVIKHDGTYTELVLKLFMFYYSWITKDLVRYIVLHDKYSPGANKLGPIEKGYKPFDFFIFFRYSIEKGIENNEFKKDVDIGFWVFTLWFKIYGLIHSTMFFIVDPDNFSNPNYQVSEMTWVKDFKTLKDAFPTVTKERLHDYVEDLIKKAIDKIKI